MCNEGFHELLNYIEPGYCTPSRGTVNSHVEKWYNEKKDEQRCIYFQLPRWLLTSDCCTVLSALTSVTTTLQRRLAFEISGPANWGHTSHTHISLIIRLEKLITANWDGYLDYMLNKFDSLFSPLYIQILFLVNTKNRMSSIRVWLGDVSNLTWFLIFASFFQLLSSYSALSLSPMTPVGQWLTLCRK